MNGGLDNNVVTRGTLKVDDELCDVVLGTTTLKWKSQQTTSKTDNATTVSLDDVIAVQKHAPREQVSVHYVEKHPDHLWSHQTATLEAAEGTDPEVIDPLVEHIQRHIETLERPKRLLVFVNPAGGAGKGVHIYQQNAEPLFQLAGIYTEVVITKNESHATEVIALYDLSTVDGVVIVGGDGTFMRCFNGLLQRMAKDAGKDLDSVNEDPVAPPIPIGTIPSGSGQGLAWSFTLTRDPTTATLHIITGQTHEMNLYSVHNAGKLLAFGGLVVSYGVSGDIMKNGEDMRYLGRARYLVAMAKAFYDMRTFDAEVYIKPASSYKAQDCSNMNNHTNVTISGDSNDPRPRCGFGDQNQNILQDAAEMWQDAEMWQVHRGSFCDIHIFLVDISPAGMVRRVKENRFLPLDPRFASLFLFESSEDGSRLGLAKSIVNMYTGDDSGTTSEHTSLVEALEAKVVLKVDELNETNNSLSIDGDVFHLTDTIIHFKGHLKLLRVFGAGYAKILGVDG